MVQMSSQGLDKVDIDFSDDSLPESVRLVKPLVFRDGDAYCCVLGPDPQSGVFGCGASPEAALEDFDNHLQDLRRDHEDRDEVAIFIEAAYAKHVAPSDDEPENQRPT